MTKSIEKQALARIYGHGRGWAFSAKDFSDLERVAMALFRLEEKGTIRRVIRGIYDYPRYSELLKQDMAPDIHKVAQALARKFGWRIQPGSAAAANIIGLSTQVPGQYIYQSDGPTRTYKIDKTELKFKHSALKEVGFKQDESAIIVRAFKAFKEEQVSWEMIEKARAWLPPDNRPKVLKDTQGITDWVYAIIKKVCHEEESNG